MPPPPAVPLVLAHGFTQSAASWAPFAAVLEAALSEAAGPGSACPQRPIVAVDLAGHGVRTDTRADLPQAAALLLRDAAAAAAAPAPAAATDADADAASRCGPVDLLGYSMGARIALRAALDHPRAVRTLVLLSGTAGMQDPVARARRRRSDQARADALEESGDLGRFLAQWLAQPMFARLRPGTDQLAARLVNSPVGLASSLRLAGTGAQDPLWDRLGELRCPLLAMAGATDMRFARHARRLASGVPHGCWALVPGAGHALHLEQPALTARIVAHWLDTVEPIR